MTATTNLPATRYPKRAHLLLCSSQASCNNADKGRAVLNTEALKTHWRKDKHSKLCFLHLTPCMGMCDVGNSGCLILPNETLWLAGLNHSHLDTLMNWLTACRDLPEEAALLPLPATIRAQAVRRLL